MSDSRDHAVQISHWFSQELFEKYVRGQLQHGGNVARKNVLSHLAEELGDAVVYLAVVQEQMLTIGVIAELGRRGLLELPSAVEMISNMVKYGNEQGEEEDELEGQPLFRVFTDYFNERIEKRLEEYGKQND